MSRLVGLAFLLADAAMSLGAFFQSSFHSSGWFLFLVVTVFTSMILAAISSAVRSVFWPSYFWDQPASAGAVVPNRRELRMTVATSLRH